jgi:hypothetical protein
MTHDPSGLNVGTPHRRTFPLVALGCWAVVLSVFVGGRFSFVQVLAVATILLVRAATVQHRRKLAATHRRTAPVARVAAPPTVVLRRLGEPV